MPDHFTTRLQLPYPDIDDPADVPADMQQLAERLDLLIPAGAGAGLALNHATVLDVGMTGQVRAGRQLTLADFTGLGLSPPLGLWNLSNLADASGSGRNLTNKGAVAFASGINGAAATAAQFTGSTAQALYIADTGAADPFRIKTGSWGCWFRTAKTTTQQVLISKAMTGAYSMFLQVTTGLAGLVVYADGTTVLANPQSTSYVADDRWHFAVGTLDATQARLYVDGVLEAAALAAFSAFTSSGPLNIGAWGADGATVASSPHFGRVDEAFVTADVLTEDQVRNLYCARIPHTLGLVPSGAKLNVIRRRRGAALAVSDFTTQPLRLHNFTAGVLTDEGSNGAALTNNGTAVPVAAADGSPGGAFSFAGAQSLSATDAGLPSGTNARSYGCWFKTASTAVQGIVGWGSGFGDVRLTIETNGLIAWSTTDTVGGVFASDGQWHHAIVTEDNAAGDGVKRKLYLDGRCIGGSTVLNAITLAGANRFRVGCRPDAGAPFTGQVDGVFVCGYALTLEDVAKFYAKGSQPLSPSPKNAGDHVEAWDAAAVLVNFDSLDSNWQVDLGVAA